HILFGLGERLRLVGRSLVGLVLQPLLLLAQFSDLVELLFQRGLLLVLVFGGGELLFGLLDRLVEGLENVLLIFLRVLSLVVGFGLIQFVESLIDVLRGLRIALFLVLGLRFQFTDGLFELFGGFLLLLVCFGQSLLFLFCQRALGLAFEIFLGRLGVLEFFD